MLTIFFISIIRNFSRFMTWLAFYSINGIIFSFFFIFSVFLIFFEFLIGFFWIFVKSFFIYMYKKYYESLYWVMKNYSFDFSIFFIILFLFYGIYLFLYFFFHFFFGFLI